MEERKKTTVAVFIDNENLRRALATESILFSDCAVCDYLAEEFGPIVLGKTYWAFGREGDQRSFPGAKVPQLFKRGVEIVLVPSFYDGSSEKNLADGKITIDVLQYLEYYPTIELWVIVSNDKDFLPLLQELRRRGKKVLLIYSQDTRILLESCERLGIENIQYQNIMPRTYLVQESYSQGRF